MNFKILIKLNLQTLVEITIIPLVTAGVNKFMHL